MEARAARRPDPRTAQARKAKEFVCANTLCSSSVSARRSPADLSLRHASGAKPLPLPPPPPSSCPPCPPGSHSPAGTDGRICRLRHGFLQIYHEGVRSFRKDVNGSQLLRLVRWPRPPQCPYLVGSWQWGHGIDCGRSGVCPPAWEAAFHRADILWNSPDLLDHRSCLDDRRQALRGVAQAPRHFYEGPALPPAHAARRYTLSYMGKCAPPAASWARQHGCRSLVRPRLNASLHGQRGNDSFRVSFVCSDELGTPDSAHGGRIKYSASVRERYRRSMNSTFVLVPRGDNRWNQRSSRGGGRRDQRRLRDGSREVGGTTASPRRLARVRSRSRWQARHGSTPEPSLKLLCPFM